LPLALLYIEFRF